VQFDVGVCNIKHDRDNDGVADAVKFAVISLQGVTVGTTAVPMVNISWQAISAVANPTTTALTIQVLTFADSDGKALPVTTQDGEVTVNPPRPLSKLYLPFVVRNP
jgi:hypothetical protein